MNRNKYPRVRPLVTAGRVPCGGGRSVHQDARICSLADLSLWVMGVCLLERRASRTTTSNHHV